MVAAIDWLEANWPHLATVGLLFWIAIILDQIRFTLGNIRNIIAAHERQRRGDE